MSCLTRTLPFHESHLFGAIVRSGRPISACLILCAFFAAPVRASTPEPPSPATTSAQGSSGRKALIQIRTSPGVYVPGPGIAVQVTSLKPVTPRVPEFLQEAIEQSLINNDHRLTPATVAPDTVISCTITDLGLATGAEARTRSEYQKIGTTTVMDADGNSHTEDQYGYVDVPYRALVFDARMSVKCEVRDAASGILLYSDKFDAVYADASDAASGASSGSLNAIYLALANNAAALILAQLSPRPYSELVTLPSGALKEASKLLEAGLWTKALEVLATVSVFKNPEDEAYRLFSIGVAHEALAFETLNPADTKAHLERALANYRRATELKPRENAFWDPKNRAELLLWQASALVAQVEAFEAAKKTALKAAPTPTPTQAPPANADLFRQVRSKTQPAPSAMDNQTVIQLVKNGASTEYITSSIKHAQGTQFVLSRAEVARLRREGVNDKVLKAMSQKQSGSAYGLSRTTRTIFTAVTLLWWVPLVFVH